MANNQAHLLALPSRYNDLEQPQQAHEELFIQPNFLPRYDLAFALVCPSPLSRFGLVERRRFLLRDGMVDATDEGDEERKVDGP